MQINNLCKWNLYFKSTKGYCCLKESWCNSAKKVVNHQLIFNKLGVFNYNFYIIESKAFSNIKNLTDKNQNVNYRKIYIDIMKRNTQAVKHTKPFTSYVLKKQLSPES